MLSRYAYDPLQDNNCPPTKWYVLCSDGKERTFTAYSCDGHGSVVKGFIRYKQYTTSGNAIWTSDGWYFEGTGKYGARIPVWDIELIPLQPIAQPAVVYPYSDQQLIGMGMNDEQIAIYKEEYAKRSTAL